MFLFINNNNNYNNNNDNNNNNVAEISPKGISYTVS